MNRLFTFGCSFTQYWRWPTWADMLGREADIFENWGLCGAGNSYIFYSLIECHERYRIEAGDTIMIMWTNTSREDRYVGDRWIEGGNVYWEGHPLGRDYVRAWACERGYLIRDLATITAARHLLNSWQCDWRFLSMVPLHSSNQANELGDNPSLPNGPDDDVRQFYQSTLEDIYPSVYETVFGNQWNSGPGIADVNDSRRRDFHPTPLEHMTYIDTVLPGLITAASREWMREQDRLARAGQLDWQQPNRPHGRL